MEIKLPLPGLLSVQAPGGHLIRICLCPALDEMNQAGN